MQATGNIEISTSFENLNEFMKKESELCSVAILMKLSWGQQNIVMI
jgi:hypothetical protein